MNYDSMTARELVHYLDLYSDDLLVRRLVKLFTHEELITELVDAGMDPETQMFRVDWGHESPGEHIQGLRNSLEHAQNEADDLRDRCEKLQEEVEQLQTRSIMEFIDEVWQEKKNNANLVKDAMATIQAFKNENENLKEKIDMWGRMNSVRS